MTPLSMNEVARQLELEPLEKFQEGSRSRPDYPRQSGRTTAMVVDAIASASRDVSVLIVAHSGEMRRYLNERIDEFLKKLDRSDLRQKLTVAIATDKSVEGFHGLTLSDHLAQGVM